MGRRPSKSRLAALTAAGWLIRLRRSDDLVVPLKQLPEHATTVGDAWLLAAAISGPCPVVGGWSAAEHRGLTEQLFRSTLSNPELPRPILHTTSGSCKPHLWHPASSGSVKYAPCALGQALEQAVHWIRQFRPVILAESTTLAGVRERAGDAGVGHLDPVSHKYGRARARRLGRLLASGCFARMSVGDVYERIRVEQDEIGELARLVRRDRCVWTTAPSMLSHKWPTPACPRPAAISRRESFRHSFSPCRQSSRTS